MRNTFNIVDILTAVLMADSGLTSDITGKVYRNGERPVNSDKEDVVVNSLPVTNDQLQRSVANVNIHVPNIERTINGIENSMPDLVRLESLTDRVILIVDEKYFADHWFFVQQQNFFQEEGQAYTNIRVEFFSENLS